MSFSRNLAAAALLGVGLTAQANPAEPTPTPAPTPAAVVVPSGPVGKLEIKETIFDAGKVERGTDVSHAFVLKNIGLGDLTVDAKPG